MNSFWTELILGCQGHQTLNGFFISSLTGQPAMSWWRKVASASSSSTRPPEYWTEILLRKRAVITPASDTRKSQRERGVPVVVLGKHCPEGGRFGLGPVVKPGGNVTPNPKQRLRNGISGSERLLYDSAKESTIMGARWCASTKRACLSGETENITSRAEPGAIFG